MPLCDHMKIVARDTNWKNVSHSLPATTSCHVKGTEAVVAKFREEANHTSAVKQQL